MSKVVYWMTVSLAGFVETRDGKIDWTAPDDELHGFFNTEDLKAPFSRITGVDSGSPSSWVSRIADLART